MRELAAIPLVLVTAEQAALYTETMAPQSHSHQVTLTSSPCNTDIVTSNTDIITMQHSQHTHNTG